MKELAQKIRLLTLCSLALYMLFPAGTAFAAGYDYTVTINPSVDVVGNVATISGTASALPYNGQLIHQHFDIIWGDGSDPQSFDGYISDPDDDGNFTFNWTESHTYADGVYTAQARLYHNNPNGAESSYSPVITVAVNKGVITVIKEVMNGDGGGSAVAGDFNLTVQGGDGATESFPGLESPGKTVFVTPGNFSVDEFDSKGYAISFFGDCSGTIASGDHKTCTVRNTYQEPEPTDATLTVVKLMINDNEGTADVTMFPLYVTNTSTQIRTGVVSEVPQGVVAGTYVVTEDQLEGLYTGSFPSAGDNIVQDCDSEGNVTLEPGDNKVCTIVNNDINEEEPTTGTITVVKEVEGGEKDVEDFPLYVCKPLTEITPPDSAYPQLTALSVSLTQEETTEEPCATRVVSGETNEFGPGEFVVTEIGDPDYTASFTGDCDSEGNILAEVGVDKTCTVTNTFKTAPTLTVTKVVVGGGYQVSQFPLYVCPVMDQQLEASITTVVQVGPCGNNVVSGETNTYEPGQYKVSETYELPYLSSMYVPTFSGDCDAQGNITLEAGDAKSCTITNTNRGGGGGGSTGGGGGGGGGGYIPRTPEPDDEPEGEVLGVTVEEIEPEEPTEPEVGEVLGETACSAYLNEYIHIRKKNNPDEVVKLKVFLNEYMGVDLVINGDYDSYAFEAVLNFQKKELEEVLAPWGITKSTGYVYKTTLRRINMIKCPELALPMPEPLVADTNIHDNF